MEKRILIQVILPLRLEWEPYYYAAADSGVAAGTRVVAVFAQRKYTAVVSKVHAEGFLPADVPNKILSISAISPLPPLSSEELKLWYFIKDYYLCTIGEVYKAAYPYLKQSQEQVSENIRLKAEAKAEKYRQAKEKTRQKLEQRLQKAISALEKARKEETKNRYSEQIIKLKADMKAAAEEEISVCGEISVEIQEPELSAAQNKALSEIKKAFELNKVCLLNGSTASGKTEIYVKLASGCLEKGKSALFLVPEVTLSRQVEERLRQHFADRLLVFHSGESPGKRQVAINRLREGGAWVVLGTRSALFLPHRLLGLIVVDEEHDRSYKQDSPAPRYNARDAAVVLGGIHSANVLLGSATPSLESLYNCSSGRWAEVCLKERYYCGGGADIELIDIVAERRKRGMSGNFSFKLIEKIAKALSEKEQVLILLGRRGWSAMVQCKECGQVPKCPHCNVSMSYHKDRSSLICHYCGHTEAFTGKCPDCKGDYLPLGCGTQKIESEVRELFPEARIGRLDGDLSQSGKSALLHSFEKGETDILIGTQSLSKGLDFERLTLVVAINGDLLLYQSDFRADEKAAQFLEQLRGRCGRRTKKGLFVIQSSNVEHPVYKRYVSKVDLRAAMMGERNLFAYPPFTRIVNIELADSSEPRLQQLSALLMQRICAAFTISPSVIPGTGNGSVSATGPFSPAIDKIADQYFRHIRMVFKKDKSLSDNKRRLDALIRSFEKESKYFGHISVDVDPS